MNLTSQSCCDTTDKYKTHELLYSIFVGSQIQLVFFDNTVNIDNKIRFRNAISYRTQLYEYAQDETVSLLQ